MPLTGMELTIQTGQEINRNNVMANAIRSCDYETVITIISNSAADVSSASISKINSPLVETWLTQAKTIEHHVMSGKKHEKRKTARYLAIITGIMIVPLVSAIVLKEELPRYEVIETPVEYALCSAWTAFALATGISYCTHGSPHAITKIVHELNKLKDTVSQTQV